MAVTVDDALQGVTDVVRGRDLLAATSVHRLLQELLGLPAPSYRHHRLVLDASGSKLSKSRGSPSLAALRAHGLSAADIRVALGFSRGDGGRLTVAFSDRRVQLSFAVAADAGFSTTSAAADGACAINWSIRSRSRLKDASILPSNSRVRASLIAIGSTKLPLMITS